MSMTMRKMVGGAALAGLIAGCAGSKEASRDLTAITPGVDESRSGIVTNVESEALQVRPVGETNTTPAWFARTEETKLERDGQPVAWDELEQGAPVRVHYEAATGAERAIKIELLTGEEAERVQAEAMQGPSWGRPEGGQTPAQPPPMGPDDQLEPTEPDAPEMPGAY